LRKQAEETYADELAKLADDVEASDWFLTAAASMRTALDATKGELAEPLTAGDTAAQLRAAREGTPQQPQPGISPSKDDIVTANIRAHDARQAELTKELTEIHHG